MEIILLIISVIIAIYLLTQKWVWLIAFGVGALASLFASIASIIHFAILPAVGLFLLAFVLWVFTIAIAEG